ncbi:SDR family oxidoreductase [Glutamicibacter sp. AOP12-B1-11]|uniref:SDR family oxidoreductase n=1 Tax=Glutamicibacter sp. AOP12-B1-11 TaxID=3457725 RepID=UPI004034895F
MSTIAVTGATGYIGGRLVPLLLERGHRVRVLTRSADRLRDVPWREQVEVVSGTLEDGSAVARLCAGADVVYYLVHSMSSTKNFMAAEERCAHSMLKAATEASVGQLVYFSGLHPEGELSDHLASRAKVGRILGSGPVPLLTLQAGLVIGSGSASFEMIRHLSDVLPVMPAPRWVLNKVQPIAVRDALHYLARCAELPAGSWGTYDIGGPLAYSYAELMRSYAVQAGLRKPWVIPLPLLTPRLASHWVNLVTPLPHTLAGALVDSLQHDCLVRNRAIDALIDRPEGGLTDYPRAVALALEKIRTDSVDTNWATAHPVSAPADPLPSDPEWAGHRVYVDERTQDSAASAAGLFTVLGRIGGESGYFSFPLLWKARGLLDKLAGGVGLRRGRRQREKLALGDVVDWWRVEALEPGQLLRLRAEMRVPGRAWLEFRLSGQEAGKVRLTQRAIFFPRGLAGRLYWWSVYPFHGLIFSSMLRSIITQAENESTPA